MMFKWSETAVIFKQQLGVGSDAPLADVATHGAEVCTTWVPVFVCVLPRFCFILRPGTLEQTLSKHILRKGAN